MDLDFVSVHKHAKKELGQYPAILTLHLVNDPYIFDKSRIRKCPSFSLLWNSIIHLHKFSLKTFGKTEKNVAIS